MHGYPMNKNEVASKVNTSPSLLGFGPWAENFEEERKNFGLFPLSPKLELVRVFLGLIEQNSDFYIFVGLVWVIHGSKLLIHFILGPTWPKMLK